MSKISAIIIDIKEKLLIIAILPLIQVNFQAPKKALKGVRGLDYISNCMFIISRNFCNTTIFH